MLCLYAQERREVDIPKRCSDEESNKLFNTRLDSKTVRAIDFHEGDAIDEAAVESTHSGSRAAEQVKSKLTFCR